jgi:hypothetical protein
MLLARDQYHQIWPSKLAFTRYLESITSASPFLSTSGVRFLRRLSHNRSEPIRRRIKKVDPEGYERLLQMGYHIQKEQVRERAIQSLTRTKLEREEIAKKILLAQVATRDKRATLYRFVQADGIVNVLASLMAAGYSKAELSKSLEVDETILDLVTPERIAEMRKRIPESIIHAADQLVYRDLVAGAVTPTTEAADKIAMRRRKMILEATRTNPRQPGDLGVALPVEEQRKKQDHAAFFDVTPKEEKPK